MQNEEFSDLPPQLKLRRGKPARQPGGWTGLDWVGHGSADGACGSMVAYSIGLGWTDLDVGRWLTFYA